MKNALLVYPKNPVTFWSFDEALKIAGKKSAFPPLGLLTIAGMLPADWTLRLVDMNVTPLKDADILAADIVITSSMIIHWNSLEDVIARCNRLHVPVLNGGPLPTQYHDDIEGEAVFYLGEAENGFLDILDRIVSNPSAVRREVIDRRGEFRELVDTPIPRWDLIRLQDYNTMMVQVTRGCPESCTFCNIPSLYGRKTRIKEKSRVVAELDALYEAGWHGGVMAVDDNFVGNRVAIREALETDVIPWQRKRGYPFRFHTQASIRLSDDQPLLEAMFEAGFGTVFAGIESPVEASLKFMGAQKNLAGHTTLSEKVRTLQNAGFEVQAGFIVGLDTDPEDIGDLVIDFIQSNGIPIAMVGILGVLRDTPDYKRFERAGRLVSGVKYTGDSGIFSRELSYVPTIDPGVLLERHRRIVETINAPAAFFDRSLRLLQRQARRPHGSGRIGTYEYRAFLRSVWRQGILGNYRAEYWKFLSKVIRRDAHDFPHAVALAAEGHHLIVSTQQALHVDEIQTFFPEALAYLERHSVDCREALADASAYANKVLQGVHNRLEQHQGDVDAVRRNAEVLLRAAQVRCKSLKREFRRQMREPLDQFRRDLERFVEGYAARIPAPATA